MEGCIWAGQEGEDAPGGLGKPNQFPEEATEAAGGEGAKGQGEPLEDNTGEVRRERSDGAEGCINAFANEGGYGMGLQFRLWADEKPSSCQ